VLYLHHGKRVPRDGAFPELRTSVVMTHAVAYARCATAALSYLFDIHDLPQLLRLAVSGSAMTATVVGFMNQASPGASYQDNRGCEELIDRPPFVLTGLLAERASNRRSSSYGTVTILRRRCRSGGYGFTG
jgi:hypothetical protein